MINFCVPIKNGKICFQKSTLTNKFEKIKMTIEFDQKDHVELDLSAFDLLSIKQTIESILQIDYSHHFKNSDY